MKKTAIITLILVISVQLSANSQSITKTSKTVQDIDLLWENGTYFFNSMDGLLQKAVVDSNTFILVHFKDSIGRNITLNEYQLTKAHDTILVSECSYKNFLDTLSSYVQRFDEEGILILIQVRKYFEPLQDGLCLFWDENKKLIRREYWEMGVLKKTEYLQAGAH